METLFERQSRRVFDFVMGGSRGGPMRMSIIGEISRAPKNTNEISRALKIDYKTAEYHLRVMRENGIVVVSNPGYGSKFSVSPHFKSWAKAHKPHIGNRN